MLKVIELGKKIIFLIKCNICIRRYDLDLLIIKCVFNLRDLVVRNCLVIGDYFVKICGFLMIEKGEVYFFDRLEMILIKWVVLEVFILGICKIYNRGSWKY